MDRSSIENAFRQEGDDLLRAIEQLLGEMDPSDLPASNQRVVAGKKYNLRLSTTTTKVLYTKDDLASSEDASSEDASSEDASGEDASSEDASGEDASDINYSPDGPPQTPKPAARRQKIIACRAPHDIPEYWKDEQSLRTCALADLKMAWVYYNKSQEEIEKIKALRRRLKNRSSARVCLEKRRSLLCETQQCLMEEKRINSRLTARLKEAGAMIEELKAQNVEAVEARDLALKANAKMSARLNKLLQARRDSPY